MAFKRKTWRKHYNPHMKLVWKDVRNSKTGEIERVQVKVLSKAYADGDRQHRDALKLDD